MLVLPSTLTRQKCPGVLFQIPNMLYPSSGDDRSTKMQYASNIAICFTMKNPGGFLFHHENSGDFHQKQWGMGNTKCLTIHCYGNKRSFCGTSEWEFNQHIWSYYIILYIYTLRLFNIAMENCPFIDDFPIKTSIYKGFSMAMLVITRGYIYIYCSRFSPTELQNFNLPMASAGSTLRRATCGHWAWCSMPCVSHPSPFRMMIRTRLGLQRRHHFKIERCGHRKKIYVFGLLRLQTGFHPQQTRKSESGFSCGIATFFAGLTPSDFIN